MDNTAARVDVREATYSLRGSAEHREALSERTASAYAGFFTSRLEPGMRLLDCGCGPGSITLDLAACVAPGMAFGIDIGSDEIAAARAAARQRGATNVQFAVANVYALPFAEGSFDALFAHTLLLHLADPPRALREMRRVLRPGGLIGLSDTHLAAVIWEPPNPLLDQIIPLLRRALVHNGGSPESATRQRALLREAGFARTEASAIVEQGGQGSEEKTRRGAEYVGILLREVLGPVALAQGWLDAETLSAMAAALQAWGEDPDAFFVNVVCQALGWV